MPKSSAFTFSFEDVAVAELNDHVVNDRVLISSKNDAGKKPITRREMTFASMRHDFCSSFDEPLLALHNDRHSMNAVSCEAFHFSQAWWTTTPYALSMRFFSGLSPSVRCSVREDKWERFHSTTAATTNYQTVTFCFQMGRLVSHQNSVSKSIGNSITFQRST